MTEYELRTKLNAETVRRTYMQKELENSQIENRLLKEKIDCLEKMIADLKAELLKQLNSYYTMSEEYQIQIRMLRNEKLELYDIITELREEAENGKVR